MVCAPRDKAELERRYRQTLTKVYPAVEQCPHCAGIGSRLLVVIDGQSFHYPNTKDGWGEALAKFEDIEMNRHTLKGSTP